MKSRKVFCICVIILLIISISTIIVSAHSGKTDSNGGHYDRSTGEYHYHHGYSAHQHIDGKCPYFFSDKTDHSSSSNFNSNSSFDFDDVKMFLVTLVLVLILSMFIWYVLFQSVLDAVLSKIVKKDISESDVVFYACLFLHIVTSIIVTILICRK